MTSNNNEKITTDQYGRKKWNLDVYLEESKNKNKQSTTPINATHQVQDTSSSHEHITQRNKLLDQLIRAVKKYNIINPETSTSVTGYGKQKRFGFFCPICDTSFRDNLLLIDHLNSPQHINKLNQLNESTDGTESEELLEGGIRRAGLKEVVSTMERLVAKSIREKNSPENNQTGGLSFQQRVERRREFEEKKKQKRIDRRNIQKKRKKQKRSGDNYGVAGDGDGDDNDEITNLMGFGGFRSTKS